MAKHHFSLFMCIRSDRSKKEDGEINKMEGSQAAPKPDRKTVEKNRRNHMKILCSKLDALLPTPSKESSVKPDRLEEAVKYIKEQQLKVERLKEKKERLMSCGGRLRFPYVEVHDMGSGLQVVLISEPSRGPAFYDVVHVLEQDGMAVVNANFFIFGDRAVHTIYCSRVADSGSGLDAGQVLERLNKVFGGSDGAPRTCTRLGASALSMYAEIGRTE